VYVVCGSTLRARRGVIRSPNYAGSYPANSNCTWKIIVRSGRTIQVNFTAFSVTGSPGSCNTDYVEVEPVV